MLTHFTVCASIRERPSWSFHVCGDVYGAQDGPVLLCGCTVCVIEWVSAPVCVCVCVCVQIQYMLVSA